MGEALDNFSLILTHLIKLCLFCILQDTQALGRNQTRQFVPCMSMFDPQSPLCLNSVRTPFCAQAQHALLAPAQLEEVGFGTVHIQARCADIAVIALTL